jgi:spore germination protein GerM
MPAVGLVLAAACSERAEPPALPAPVTETGAAEPSIAPVQRLAVWVYYPSAAGDGLIGEPHEIFATSTPGDRAKQILADLIAGPVSKRALPALPPATRLRQVYVLEDGTAYVDLSEDVRQGLGGGSAEELYAVYSIVDSLVVNVPEIRRVGILIEGKEIETLNGHLDLRRPLPADGSLILESTIPDVVRQPAPREAKDA